MTPFNSEVSKMKILTTSVFLLLNFANFRVCYTEEPLKVVSKIIGSTSDVHKIGQRLWNLENREQVLTNIRNFKIQQKIKPVNVDTLTVLGNAPEQDTIAENINALDQKIVEIENFYKDMVEYYRNHQNLTSSSEDSMVVSCYSVLQNDINKPMNVFDQIVDILALRSLNILDELNKMSQNFASSCSTDTSRKSLQSIIYKYFELTKYLQIKMYMMLKIAFSLLNQHEPDDSNNIHLSYHKMLEILISRDEQIRNKFETVLSEASRDVWRCDPEPQNYHEDSSYTQLNHVFQGHIRNLRDIQKASSPSCSAQTTCVSENPTEENHCYSFTDEVDPNSSLKSLVCQKQRKCAGKLWNCQEVFKDWNSTINICLSHKHSHRSYDFVKTSNQIGSIYYGPYSTCGKPMVYEYSKNMAKQLFPLLVCDVCYCICDDDLDYETMKTFSDRLFFTRFSESDISENYVVTGARIRKLYGIFYLQIQQGQLLENGKINQSSVHWREEYFDYLTNSKHHFKLHWRARSIELQDIDVPSENVLVGLKIENVTKDGVERLRLVALSRPFNYTSGKLSLEEEVSFMSKTEASSDGIEIHDLKLPDSSRKNEIIVSNKYLNFSISYFDSDLGQSTIPFIDIQDVTTKEPSAMSGAGLYYKKSLEEDVAGFIGLKLKTYDFSRHFHF